MFVSRTVPGIAACVFVMILAGCGSGAQPQASSGSLSTATEGPIESQGPAWNAARTSGDGRSILLVFTGGPDFDPADPCSYSYRADVDEADDAVTIGLVAMAAPPRTLSSDGGPMSICPSLGYPRDLTVDLEEPVGDRQLIEARTGDTTPPFDGSTLVHPGWIPEGWVFRGEGAAFPEGDTSQTWSQGWGAPITENFTCPGVRTHAGHVCRDDHTARSFRFRHVARNLRRERFSGRSRHDRSAVPSTPLVDSR